MICWFYLLTEEDELEKAEKGRKGLGFDLVNTKAQQQVTLLFFLFFMYPLEDKGGRMQKVPWGFFLVTQKGRMRDILSGGVKS